MPLLGLLPYFGSPAPNFQIAHLDIGLTTKGFTLYSFPPKDYTRWKNLRGAVDSYDPLILVRVMQSLKMILLYLLFIYLDTMESPGLNIT